MRLTTDQVIEIHAVLKKHFNETPYQLFLYGSRVHEQLKGGDIDLLILTSNEGVLYFSQHSLDILVAIKKQPHIGQRRIDLRTATVETLKTDPFLKTISQEMLELDPA